MKRVQFFLYLSLMIFAICLPGVRAQVTLRAGAAEREITPPVGHQIQHYFRLSVGVHDPLFARCLYLEDAEKNSLVIICL
ncbi:MAG: hypothetical protein NZ935_06430, partial [Planctomycetes bacterium]|nr:hypothetical protein [Planctomycetota bacterium]